MPHLRSLYPDPLPVPDYLNIYETIIGQPQHDEWPDYIVHIDEETGQSRTFKDLRKRINDLASVLGGPVAQGGLGLKAEDGDVVGIMSDNSSDYMVLVIALLKIAVPFTLISCYSTPFELKHALGIAKVKRLFTASHYIPKALPVVEEVGIPRAAVYTMDFQIKAHESLDGFIKKANITNIPHSGARIVPKDTLAFLFFSSGTTGLPKAVKISHGNLLFAYRQAAVLQQHRLAVMKPPTPSTPDGLPVILAFLPMHHTFGLHLYCIRGFMVPTRFVIFRKWNVAQVLKAVPIYKATQLSMVPSMWYQVVNHPDFEKTDFNSVLGVHSGAAHLPKEIAAKVLRYTPNNTFFSDGYGMSETTVSAIVRPLPGTLNGRLKDVPNTLGVLLPGMEARIVREDGSEADFDEVGELWLKGGNIVSGYFDDIQATKTTFVDGWLRTGDQFRIDRGHYFSFADRAKDTLKVSGSQVSPVEIEEVLRAHPQKLVSDVTVAGVAGSGRTVDEKVPRAWIVLSGNGKKVGAAEVVQELERWHQANLSKYKWLRGGIEVIEEIPKSPTGKTLRRILQDEYERRAKSKSKL
ncbi:acetyl-CoA synthetase-like protein [Macrolepiota fuliginosa MF-IS2]|uniref:Acetyl-CoA synthetase-like protein n=1 Tax=Macrolepiota fuliginosa MF-IS2 TaxID=1400762 RepID=A0A9P5XI53_9AGAR|nr:acetyl-CoA synthetase-like protein [Macrolepiota fuliginosa MF-IS2]